MLERIAHAKINLALHITGQRADGYHMLDSLVVFTKLGDKLRIIEASDATRLITLKLEGPYSCGLSVDENNLVIKSANALAETVVSKNVKLLPVTIMLEKNLPVASGIGGGSADAAAALLALREFWELDVDLHPIAANLGADVPMCLHSKPLRASGIGDEITLLSQSPSLHMVLVNPNVEVSTPEIFNKLQRKANAAISQEAIGFLPLVDEISHMRNDLEVPAIEICPIIGDVLQALAQTDCTFFRMSGSGATCFALYEDNERAKTAAQHINQAHPDWWCMATQTTVS